MKWTWSWTPPIDASFGDNLLFDWIRVGCVVLGAMLIMAIGRVMVEQSRRPGKMPPTHSARFVSLALAVVYIGATEVAVLGTVATPRLLVGVVVMALGFYGVWGMRRKQKNAPPPR